MQEYLDKYFPEPYCHYLANAFYSWLRSPKNKPLQLDFLVYLKGKMLFSIEIEGKQHYQKMFWQKDEDFQYLQDCDILKARTMKLINVPLLKIKAEQVLSEEDFLEILAKNNIYPLVAVNV